MTDPNSLPRLADLWSAPHVFFEQDDYIPFILRIREQPDAESLGERGHYFVQGQDAADGLVEASFHLATGRLTDLRVVHMPTAEASAPDLGSLPTEDGSPVFGSLALDPEAPMPARRLTQPVSACALPDGGHYFCLDPGRTPTRAVRAGPAIFTFADDEWVGFGRISKAS